MNRLARDKSDSNRQRDPSQNRLTQLWEKRLTLFSAMHREHTLVDEALNDFLEKKLKGF